MGAFRHENDPKLPATTILTPQGRKIRITEFPTGELRLKVTPGPMAITGAALEAETVTITMIPFAEDVVTKVGGAVGETITNCRRFAGASRDVLSAITGLAYQLGISLDSSKAPEARVQAGRSVEGLIDTVWTAFALMGFLGTLQTQLNNTSLAADLKALGQYAPLKSLFSTVVAVWTGDNHVKKSIPELFADVTALIGKLPEAEAKHLAARWRKPNAQQPDVYAAIVEMNKELLRREPL